MTRETASKIHAEFKQVQLQTIESVLGMAYEHQDSDGRIREVIDKDSVTDLYRRI